MLVELTSDEFRFLTGLLNERLGELRAEIRDSEPDAARLELQREEIKLNRIVRRLESARETPIREAV